jgi:hypothetical protein
LFFPPPLKNTGFVRDIAKRVIEQNNQLIQKLEMLVEDGVPF